MIRVARIVPVTNAPDLVLGAPVDTQNEDSVLFRDNACAGSDRGGRLAADEMDAHADVDRAGGVEALAITVPLNSRATAAAGNAVVAAACCFAGEMNSVLGVNLTTVEKPCTLFRPNNCVGQSINPLSISFLDSN